ncbi:MAG: carboxypeptidase-like regulatory domain-containing protein [Methanobrevibacter boviskoreani]|uniref:carboxypeptidase-like regulatory domain-containing protein n=1 Tax=Methanobrevibacter boviskoreani TaxID=1348249 RepID=UPI0023A85D13|nr:carboxypeptidase-like regulatory domain-containing protein [Methanobrevibacter boviskoreani]MCI6930660.1 carboxypeptidase-like regulatory domain-containing protein [Methanobrevibacter boviskoreani]
MHYTINDGTNPITGATVTLKNKVTEEVYTSGKSGSTGGCNINNVPVGSYVVTVECTGYTTITNDLDVEGNADKIATLTVTT